MLAPLRSLFVEHIAFEHLIVAPIVLPLLTGAAMLLISDRRRRLRSTVYVLSTLALLAIAVVLLVGVDQGGFKSTQGAVEAGSALGVGVYLPGNWPVPIGIALALDRLSALMLVLSASLGLIGALYAFGRWDRAGAHYLPIFQFQLMGLNGAFLTADLFNLFVFFELLLAASYGLVLHGGGAARVRAGLHYLVINLTGASLFLIGISLIYAVTGTLSMADIARRVPTLAAEDIGLFQSAVGLLGVVFLIKAAARPLNFWLPSTYAAASAPVACMFALMTKVGLYAILRLGSLLLSDFSIGNVNNQWLQIFGLVTLGFGLMGVFSCNSLPRLGGYVVIVSSGTLLAAFGIGDVQVIAGALFYLINSTLAIAAFFLLIEIIEQGREQEPLHPADRAQLNEQLDQKGIASLSDLDIIGVPIAASTAFLGLNFIGCALLLSGLPPFSGFIAKFSMLTALLIPLSAQGLPLGNIALFIMVLVSSLVTAIAFTRMGIKEFWARSSRSTPELRIHEFGAISVLMIACVGLTVFAAPLSRYLQDIANTLHQPSAYIQSIIDAQGVRLDVDRGH